MAARFVSEKDLEDEKKRRQEEWDRVRQPGQPEEAPEPQDNRPLYDRLKQQRDQKQLEFEETHKLKNLLRGLDSEEVGFLDYVDKVRREEELKRLNEERALISEVKKNADASLDPVDPLKIDELKRKPIQSGASKSKERSKQAQLLAGAVKKRKADDEADGPSEEKKTKSAGDGQQSSSASSQHFPSAMVVAGVRASATRTRGSLPGLESYAGSDSDDSSNSSADTDEAENWTVLTTPVQLKLERQQKQAEAAARNGDC